MKSYRLEATGNSTIAASLAKLCQQGEIGEPLIIRGFSQSNFTQFIAALCAAQLAKGKTAAQLAAVLEMVSACNASAARQAMENGISVFGTEHNKKDKEGKETEVTLETLWERLGTKKAAPNLALLD